MEVESGEEVREREERKRWRVGRSEGKEGRRE